MHQADLHFYLGVEAKGYLLKVLRCINVASFVPRDGGAIGKVGFFVVVFLIHIVWRECTSYRFTTSKFNWYTIITLLLALCHCEAFYCYFGMKSTNLCFYCNEESIKTIQIMGNESDHVSDSQDELES